MIAKQSPLGEPIKRESRSPEAEEVVTIVDEALPSDRETALTRVLGRRDHPQR
jgi:hypothetical protein